MSFYSEWQDILEKGLSDEQYVKGFLDYSEQSLSVLYTGNETDILGAITLLLSVPISTFISAIDHDYSFFAKDVIQYSKLEDATITICNILEYEEVSLSYEEAGKKLTHAPQQYACIKYGENHAKTAAALSLVIIEKNKEKKCNLVRISPLGSISTLLDNNDRQQLIRRLAIRNPFIKSLIFRAKQGDVSYKDCVSSALSGETIVRRKHNNEILINLILENEPINNNIRWS